MGKEILTDEMIHFGESLLQGLDKTKISIKAFFWYYFEDEAIWKLIIGTPEARTEGPKKVYKKIIAALQKIPGQSLVRLQDITVTDDKDPLVLLIDSIVQKTLESSTNTRRFSENVVNGKYIKDSLIYRAA